MRGDTADLAGTASWAARRYWWVLVASVTAALALAWAMTVGSAPPPRYEATALVVANSVEIAPEQLARFGAAVFESASVSEGIILRLSLDVEPAELIPDLVAVDPVPDSIVFLVHGRSSDPVAAADLANAAATVFVQQLNRAGPGIATFSVQDEARRPTEPVPTLDPLLALISAGVAGVLLGIVVVAMVVTWRNPALTPDDITTEVGIPVLAHLSVGRVPDRRGGVTLAAHPLGLRALADRLGQMPYDGFVLVGEPHSRELRASLIRSLTAEAGAFQTSEGDGAVLPVPRVQGGIVLLEDWSQNRGTASSWGLVAVVEYGRSTRRLVQLLHEWHFYGSFGAVMVRRVRRTRAWST